jgi:DNA-binding HxlR family transcriptional regulator
MNKHPHVGCETCGVKCSAILHVVKNDLHLCPVHSAIEILQEKWVLHIIHALLEGPRGFNELGRDIGGCNPTTLAQRLDKLESLGLVDKTVCSVMPPKSSYSLTEAGLALQVVIDAIHAWSVTHLPEPVTA